MSSRPGLRAAGCGDDCRYKKLYEGSQESLNDMASKHAAALRRVGTLRSGLLGTLKQTFPGQYAAAERQLGHKLTAEKEDSVLLAFLAVFLRDASPVRAPSPMVPAGLEELRGALGQTGLRVEGTDLHQWAQAVRTALPVAAQATAPVVAAAARGSFADERDAPPPPEDPGAYDAPPPPDLAPAASHDLEDLFGPPPSEAHPASENWDLSHLFDDGPSPAAPSAPATDDGAELLNRLYGEEVPSTYQPAAAAPQELAAEPDPVELLVPAPVPETAAERKGGARVPSTVLRPEMFPATQVPRAPRKRTPSKSTRVTAAAPGAPAADEAPAPAVATDRFGELLALVSRPKPMFMSDLVAACGSPGLVAAWEQHFQDQGTAAPVRVITPRAHHRHRGSLVVPHSPELRAALAENGKNWWTDCLDDGADRARLRGARLYETAVLLHRFADSIVSYKLTANVLSLKLNTPSGLTGVVMWVGSDLTASPGREALTDAVGDMITDRLVLLAVLTHETGARSVERLTGLLGEDAVTFGWAPVMPVVASHSWDFASDGGASALSVL